MNLPPSERGEESDARLLALVCCVLGIVAAPHHTTRRTQATQPHPHAHTGHKWQCGWRAMADAAAAAAGGDGDGAAEDYWALERGGLRSFRCALTECTWKDSGRAMGVKRQLMFTLRRKYGLGFPRGSRSPAGESPLFEALRFGWLAFAELLLEMGAWVVDWRWRMLMAPAC